MSDGFDDKEFVPDVPTVRLGHRDYPLEEMTWRDTRAFTPLVKRMRAVNVEDPSDADWDALGDVVHFIITRSEPDCPRDSVDGMRGLTLIQIQNALPTILRQAGLVAVPKQGEPPATSG